MTDDRKEVDLPFQYRDWSYEESKAKRIEAIINGLNRFRIREEELGDDPVKWRQNDTVDRIAKYLEEVLK